MRLLSLLVMVLIGLSSCAPIKHTALLEQPRGTVLSAGPGDVMVRVQKQRDLENISGHADLWGRKTNEGYSELHFQGVAADGSLILYRSDVSIISNETTMSRSPFTSSYGHATVNSSGPNFASANVYSTTIAPTSDYHAVVPQGTLPIILPSGQKALVFEGSQIEIISAAPGVIAFRVN